MEYMKHEKWLWLYKNNRLAHLEQNKAAAIKYLHDSGNGSIKSVDDKSYQVALLAHQLDGLGKLEQFCVPCI